MIEKISTAGMSREDWLEVRRKSPSIGGSECGAILGMNPYESAVSVWAKKSGRIAPEPENESMRIGRDLEPYVAERFSEASGYKVANYNFMLVDAENHLHANIDRRVLGIAGNAGLECKTASALNEKKFKGGSFPESYYAQCCCYLAVTGWARWYLAVLILGRGFTIYQLTTIPEDTCPEWCESSVFVAPEELQALRDMARTWYAEHIDADVMPAVDGSASTSEALRELYKGGGSRLELPGFHADLEAYTTLKAEIDNLTKAADAIKQKLMAEMGDSEKAICGSYSISWKPQERRSFDKKRFAKDHPNIDLDPYYNISTLRPMRIDRKEG